MFSLRTYIIFFALSIFPYLYGMQSTPLIEAVRNKNIELVKLLLAENVNVNEQNSRERVALHYAVEDNNLEIVKLLLEQKDIDANIQDDLQNTPLHLLWLAEGDPSRKEILQLFLAKKANLNTHNRQGRTFLHQEIYRLCSASEIQMLLNNGADPIIRTYQDETALDLSFADQSYLPTIKLLIKPSLLCNIYDRTDGSYHLLPDTPFNQGLLYIIEDKPDKLLLFLSEVSSIINQQDELGATLLMYAAALARLECVKVLLNKNADPLIRTKYGKTAKKCIQHILDYHTTKPILNEEEHLNYLHIITLLDRAIAVRYTSFMHVATKTALPQIPLDLLKVIFPFFIMSHLYK